MTFSPVNKIKAALLLVVMTLSALAPAANFMTWWSTEENLKTAELLKDKAGNAPKLPFFQNGKKGMATGVTLVSAALVVVLTTMVQAGVNGFVGDATTKDLPRSFGTKFKNALSSAFTPAQLKQVGLWSLVKSIKKDPTREDLVTFGQRLGAWLKGNKTFLVLTVAEVAGACMLAKGEFDRHTAWKQHETDRNELLKLITQLELTQDATLAQLQEAAAEWNSFNTDEFKDCGFVGTTRSARRQEVNEWNELKKSEARGVDAKTLPERRHQKEVLDRLSAEGARLLGLDFAKATVQEILAAYAADATLRPQANFAGIDAKTAPLAHIKRMLHARATAEALTADALAALLNGKKALKEQVEALNQAAEDTFNAYQGAMGGEKKCNDSDAVTATYLSLTDEQLQAALNHDTLLHAIDLKITELKSKAAEATSFFQSLAHGLRGKEKAKLLGELSTLISAQRTKDLAKRAGRTHATAEDAATVTRVRGRRATTSGKPEKRSRSNGARFSTKEQQEHDDLLKARAQSRPSRTTPHRAKPVHEESFAEKSHREAEALQKQLELQRSTQGRKLTPDEILAAELISGTRVIKPDEELTDEEEAEILAELSREKARQKQGQIEAAKTRILADATTYPAGTPVTIGGRNLWVVRDAGKAPSFSTTPPLPNSPVGEDDRHREGGRFSPVVDPAGGAPIPTATPKPTPQRPGELGSPLAGPQFRTPGAVSTPGSVFKTPTTPFSPGEDKTTVYLKLEKQSQVRGVPNVKTFATLADLPKTGSKNQVVIVPHTSDPGNDCYRWSSTSRNWYLLKPDQWDFSEDFWSPAAQEDA